MGTPGRGRPADIDEGRHALGVLLRALPSVEAIVTYGSIALEGVMRHLTLDEHARLVPVIAAPHPLPPTAATARNSTDVPSRHSDSPQGRVGCSEASAAFTGKARVNR